MSIVRKQSALAKVVAPFLALSLALGWVGAVGAEEDGPPHGPPPAPRHVAGELLVQYNAGKNEHEKAAARTKVGAAAKRLVRRGPAGDLELAQLPPGKSAEDAARELKGDPTVAFAEPNWVFTHSAATEEPSYASGSLWGLYGDATSPTNRFGSQAGEAWARNAGSASVVIGVIDEGIDVTHPDLAANVWRNPAESGLDANGLDRATNGVDDDGNGYADDVNGYDFANNDAGVFDGPTDDHGTHVAGTIGAAANGAGVVGVSPNVTLVSAKFLNPDGGTLENAVRAVDYFTALKQRGVNVVALNNSWGGGGYSQALHDAIIRAAKAQILFVAAAGNSGYNNDVWAHYPSNYRSNVGTTTESAAGWDNVVAVAAIGQAGLKASWSNYGRSTVDLGAPGVDILSTVPGGYGYMSGTSMATPHVTGGAALYAASHPGATGAELRSAILSSAVATSSLNKKTATGGRLNVGAF
jgi:subtilisin family serine protease